MEISVYKISNLDQTSNDSQTIQTQLVECVSVLGFWRIFQRLDLSPGLTRQMAFLSHRGCVSQIRTLTLGLSTWNRNATTTDEARKIQK